MKKILPPTYFFGAIALMAGFHFLFPLWTLVRFPWRLLGVVPLVAGVLLNLLADQAFRRSPLSAENAPGPGGRSMPRSLPRRSSR